MAEGNPGLIASLLCGTGLRLMECLRLRVQAIEYSRCGTLLGVNKGLRDRVTTLPESLVTDLEEHPTICHGGWGRIRIPIVPDRQYPSAPAEQHRRWVFAQEKRLNDRRASNGLVLASVPPGSESSPQCRVHVGLDKARRRPCNPSSLCCRLW